MRLTAFLDDVQTRVCDVVVFQLILAWLGECANQYRVVLRRDEGDCVKAKLWRHSAALVVVVASQAVCSTGARGNANCESLSSSPCWSVTVACFDRHTRGRQ